MAAETLDKRKMNLIVQITLLNDEKSVRQVEDFVNDLEKRPTERQLEMLKKLAKPMRKKIDIEELKGEQNWKPSSQKEIDELIEKINLQEPIEQLLEDIK